MKNIYMLSKGCGNERKNIWQRNNKTTIIINGICKLMFEQDGISEHMWVEVIKFHKGLYQGILVNDPISMSNINYGDKVIFEHSDIEDYKLT